MSNIWPWSATRMLNLSATATLRICATPDSRHVKETHLDQTVLVSARGTNRNTIQPLGQLEASCQDTTKRSHNRRQSLHMECTLGQTRHTKSCWLRKGEPNEAFQLPAGYLKWLGVEPQWRFSDTLSILAQRHMSGHGVMGCWTSQTMQNAAVCFEEGHQKPLLQSTCWRVLFQVCKSNVKIRLLKRSCVKPGSTICPPVFGGEMEVAACSFPESKQIEGPRGPSKQYEAKAWIYALWSIPDLLPECQTCQHLQTLRICATSDSKHVKETKLDQTASLNSVVHFLLVWTVDVELLFEIANSLHVQPPFLKCPFLEPPFH